jgi:hypothetical protein
LQRLAVSLLTAFVRMQMDHARNELEALAIRSLTQRGLLRAAGELAFVHNGQTVKLSIDASVYRGYFVTVHDGARPPRQFRAVAGGHDWNAIAAHIRDIANDRNARVVEKATGREVKEQNRRLAEELCTLTGAGPDSRLSIQPSASAPGRVRVRLDEVDLDPESVIQIYAAVTRARAKAGGQR